MAHYGTLRDYHFVDNESAADDIRGSKVYDLKDEKLGKIDDVIFAQGYASGEAPCIARWPGRGSGWRREGECREKRRGEKGGPQAVAHPRSSAPLSEQTSYLYRNPLICRAEPGPGVQKACPQDIAGRAS